MSELDRALSRIAAQGGKDKPQSNLQQALGQLDARRDVVRGAALEAANDVTPDQAAEFGQLADLTGLTYEQVHQHPDMVRDTVKRRSVREQLRDAPVLSQFVSNPRNAALSQDSLENLAKLEAAIRGDSDGKTGKGIFGSVANVGTGIGQRTVDLFLGLAGASGTVLTEVEARALYKSESDRQQVRDRGLYKDGLDILRNGLSAPYPGNEGVSIESLILGASEEGGSSASGLLEKVAGSLDFNYTPGKDWEEVKNDPVGSFIPWATETGLVSIPDMVAAVYALPAYVAARTGELGQTRAENDTRNAATVEDLASVLPASVGSAMLERFGARGVLGLDDVVRGSGVGDVAGAVGVAALKESITEGAQEGLESVAETLGTERGFSLPETAERAFAGSLAGGFFGGAIRTPTAAYEARQHAKNKLEEAQTQQAVETISALRESVEEAPLFQRDQAALQEFLSKATDGETVLLDGMGLSTLYQSEPAAFQEIADTLGLSEEQIIETFNGGDVEVEVAKLLTFEDRAGFDQLLEIARTSPEALTLQEVRTQQEEQLLSVDYQDAFERFEEQDRQLEGFERAQRSVRDQLVAAGRTQEEASAAGTLFGSFFRVLSDAGLDEAQVFERLGLRIDGPNTPARQPDVTLNDGTVYTAEDITALREQAGVTIPNKPQPLGAFVRSIGLDPSSVFEGEVGEIDTTGLIDRAGGQDLDVIAQRAADEGYLPLDENGKADVATFLESLAADYRAFQAGGERVFRPGDSDAVAGVTAQQDARALLDEVETKIAEQQGEADQAVLNQAQSEGYEGQDGGEAVEWLEAVAKGLDMSTEARMERAKAMGFDVDTVFYHGTDAIIKKFSKLKRGAVTGAKSAKLGTWMTSSPRTAEGYAEYANIGRRYEVLEERLNKLYELSGGPINRIRIGRAQRQLDDFSDQTYGAEDYAYGREQIMPLFISGKVKELNMSGAYYGGDTELASLAAKAKNEGYDGLKLENFGDEADGGGRVSDHVVIFKPQHIRSVYAAFDPEKANSANLLHQFIGERSQDPIVQDRLTEAKELEAQGFDRDVIWQRTLAYRGVDGKWRAEIDDSGVELSDAAIAARADKAEISGDQLLEGSGIAASYPDLLEGISVLVEFATDKSKGRYNAKSNELDLETKTDEDTRSLALHELQHAIQVIEGFAYGGSVTHKTPFIAAREKQALVKKTTALANRALQGLKGRTEERQELIIQLDSEVRDLQDEVQRASGLTPYEFYKRLAGEVEAYNVQARQDMSIEERRETPPWATQEFDDAEQFIRVLGKDVLEERDEKLREAAREKVEERVQIEASMLAAAAKCAGGGTVGQMVAGNLAGLSIGGTGAAIFAYSAGADERRLEAIRFHQQNLSSADIREERAKSAKLEASVEEDQQAEADALNRYERALEAHYSDINNMPDDPRFDVNGWAEKFTGIDAAYLDALVGHEAGDDWDAQAVTSSAQGGAQFISSTWRTWLSKYGSKYGEHPDPYSNDSEEKEAALALRNDRRWGTMIAAEFTRENVLFLQNELERPVTGKEAYLAHFLGRDQALKMLKADPASDAAAGFPREADSNRPVFYKGCRSFECNIDGLTPRTVREVIAKQGRAFPSQTIFPYSEPIT